MLALVLIPCLILHSLPFLNISQSGISRFWLISILYPCKRDPSIKGFQSVPWVIFKVMVADVCITVINLMSIFRYTDGERDREMIDIHIHMYMNICYMYMYKAAFYFFDHP